MLAVLRALAHRLSLRLTLAPGLLAAGLLPAGSGRGAVGRGGLGPTAGGTLGTLTTLLRRPVRRTLRRLSGSRLRRGPLGTSAAPPTGRGRARCSGAGRLTGLRGPDRGDQVGLAHAGGALDPQPAGHLAQLGQHFGLEPTRGALGRRRGRVVHRGRRIRRFGHGIPFRGPGRTTDVTPVLGLRRPAVRISAALPRECPSGTAIQGSGNAPRVPTTTIGSRGDDRTIPTALRSDCAAVRPHYCPEGDRGLCRHGEIR
ncbi:hypothetical protein SDC9_133152 [bioreactor metagenome]|uniref:Uncharacterized protein n=1 Tax=bioreactor metagenome TaxID=1076179 RepID=A0A645DA54_9ZZZZ